MKRPRTKAEYDKELRKRKMHLYWVRLAAKAGLSDPDFMALSTPRKLRSRTATA